MTRTKFQTESMQRERSNRLAPSPPAVGRFALSEPLLNEQSSARTITATVEPMFLGLLLRGWITEREQQFLDDLVPVRSLSFLISDDKYVHPAGIELFPHSLIEASIEQRNPAIFSHLCPEVTKSKRGSYRINTVIVNPDESRPIVFGVFGPEYELTTTEFEGMFLGLADRLRSGFKSARQAEALLHEKVISGKPTIIINRASGYILAANQPAVDRFGVSEQILVDQEFGATRALLPDLMIGAKRRIENITCNELSLSLISTSLRPDSELSPAELTGFLTAEIESRLAMLSDSYSNSDPGIGEDQDCSLPGQESVFESIVSHIKHDLEKINLVGTTGRHDSHRTNTLWELDRAVDTVSKLPGCARVIQINNRTVNLEHRAPRKLLANLFETILMAHQADSSQAIRTDIHVLRSSGSPSVSVKVKTRTCTSPYKTQLHKQWAACAEFLARQAGVTIEHRSDNQDASLITMINIEQFKE